MELIWKADALGREPLLGHKRIWRFSRFGNDAWARKNYEFFLTAGAPRDVMKGCYVFLIPTKSHRHSNLGTFVRMDAKTLRKGIGWEARGVLRHPPEFVESHCGFVVRASIINGFP